MLNISQTKLVALLQLSFTAGYEQGEMDAGALRNVSAPEFDSMVNEFVDNKISKLTQETA
jgi:hypothetical protein